MNKTILLMERKKLFPPFGMLCEFITVVGTNLEEAIHVSEEEDASY